MSTGLSLKPVTPGSLKVMIALEGLAILLLGSWLYVEYNYSSSFRSLLNDLVFARITMWTLIIGLSVGLVGSATALGSWRKVRQMRFKIETLEGDLMETSKRILEKPSAPFLAAASSQAELEVHWGSSSLNLLPSFHSGSDLFEMRIL